MKTGRTRSRFLVALLGFMILSGVILVLVGSTDGRTTAADSPREQAWAAMKSAEAAERSLERNDYGEAREHLRKTHDQLGKLIKELE